MDWFIDSVSEADALKSALCKARVCHAAELEGLQGQALAAKACDLGVPHLSGPELLALARAAGPLEL